MEDRLSSSRKVTWQTEDSESKYSWPDYQRLAGISVSHRYNLRQSTAYRNQRERVQPTQSRPIAIGERRKPDPKGQHVHPVAVLLLRPPNL